MKKLLPAFALLVAQNIGAQVISWANYSQFPSRLIPAKIANTSSFNAGLATNVGNGIAWDASGLTPDGSKPSLILGYYPSAKSSFGALYSNTQLVRLDTNYLAQLSQDFFQLNADSMTLAGSYDPTDGEHEIYTNPMKMLRFPMNFGESFVDDYAKTNYSDATTISSYQTGTNTSSFGGYGTLKLPQGSFLNVAMISMVRTNNLGPNSLDVSWYDNNTGSLLMNFHSNNGSSTVVYTTQVPAATGVSKFDVTNDQLRILNNGERNLSLENTGVKPIAYRIFNTLGVQLAQGEIEAQSTIDLLPMEISGLYYLELDGGDFYRLVK